MKHPQFTVNTFNLQELEKAAVLAAITYTEGNIRYAKELLNVSVMTTYRLLDIYNIDYLALRKARYDRNK